MRRALLGRLSRILRFGGTSTSMCVATLAAFLVAGAWAAARTMTLDDDKLLVGISDAQISPDGTRIAFIVSRQDFKNDRRDSTLMLMDVKTGEQRPLTYQRKGLGDPRWSPDGSRIAFTAWTGEGDDAGEQLFVMDMRGGDPIPITHAPRGVEQFTWRPDGRAFAYVTPDESKNAADAKKHLDAFVVGDQPFSDRSAPTPNHIWLINADGTGDRRLTSGSWSLPTSQPPSSPASPLSWSPNGSEIVFTKMPNAYDADGDLAVVAIVNVQTGAIRTLTTHGKYEGYGDFSPDGTRVAYWYPFEGDEAAQNDIFVAPAAGGNGDDVTRDQIDTNVQRAIWLPGSKALLIAGHKDTDAALWVKPLGAPAKRVNLHGVQPSQFFWLDASVANTGAIAFVGSEATHPSEVYYMASPDAAPRRMTSYNETIAQLDLGRSEAITWQGPDGFTEDGVLTYPPNRSCTAQAPCPLVLVIHGGPNSASVTGFSDLAQLVAARGYLVFRPNYRGSDNLGEKYWHAIVNDAGDGPGKDVMAGIAALEARGIVDTSRIAVTGWSYGGYMTAWLIGHYHIWKAAVAGAPVTDWMDEYVLSDNNVGVRYAFNGATPFVGSGMATYMAQSPITYDWNATAPTLILADTGDVRVPITQSYKLYHALKDHGDTVRFFAYPVAGHSPSDPVRSLDVYRRWIDWVAGYLK